MFKHKIFDDVFDFGNRVDIFNYLIKQPYRLGWHDRDDKCNLLYLHSEFNYQNMNQIKFFESIKNQELKDFIEEKTISKVVVNASFPGYFFHQHTHAQYAIVYYANLEWQEHWAGETIIYDENGRDIHACIPYTPGRVLLIDRNMPHALRPPTFQAPFYRFTISLFYV